MNPESASDTAKARAVTADRTFKEKQLEEKNNLLQQLRAELQTKGTPVEVRDTKALVEEVKAKARRAADAALLSTSTAKAASPQAKLIKESQTVLASVNAAPLEEQKDQFVPVKEEAVKYVKGIQTDEVEVPPFSRSTTQRVEERIPDDFPEIAHGAKEKEPSEEEESKEPEQIVITKMAKEKVQALFANPDFSSFAERSTMVLEKALNVDKIVNIYRDYAGKDETDAGVDILGPLTVYEDSRYSSRRIVSGLLAVPRTPDQFLACYGVRRDASLGEPEGVVVKWGLDNPSRPEQVLISPSAAVTCVTTSKGVTDHNLIFGGTKTGSILMWDPNSKQRPIQKTQLTGTGEDHETQIQSAYIVGSGNSAELVTIDLDLRICYWSFSKSLALLRTSSLRESTSTGQKQRARRLLYSSCVKGNILYGERDDGSLFEWSLHTDEAKKAAPAMENRNFHRGPIIGIDLQPHHQRRNAEMILTSSIDWTVKLWDSTGSRGYVPIHTFDMQPGASMVTDVKWSPSHPSIFGAVMGNGYFNLWDLNASWDNPLLSTNLIGKDVTGGLTRLGFLMDGSRIMAGTSLGRICSAGLSSRAHRAEHDLSVFEIRHAQARLKAEPGQQKKYTEA